MRVTTCIKKGDKKVNLSKKIIDMIYIANQRLIVDLQGLCRAYSANAAILQGPPGAYGAFCTILSRLMNATFVLSITFIMVRITCMAWPFVLVMYTRLPRKGDLANE